MSMIPKDFEDFENLENLQPAGLWLRRHVFAGYAIIHAATSLDLSERSSQEPQVSSGHPNKARYDFRNELFVREDDAGRGPSPFEQFLDLSCIEGYRPQVCDFLL